MSSGERSIVQLKHRPEVGRKLSLEVHPRGDAVSDFLRVYGIWQRPVTVFASYFLQPGEVAVDVGAQIGYFSAVFAEAVGSDGAVHAFEPDPDNFAVLARNRSLNGHDQIICRETVVLDRSEEVTLYKAPLRLWGSSLFKKAMHRSEVSVPSAPLDQLLDQEERPIGLIKIDVEGAELKVLRGMERTLERQAIPPAVIVEFSSRLMEIADPGLEFIVSFISRFGYQVRPFISHEGPTVLPPRVALETLAAMHKDFLRFSETAELDLLLIRPESLERWKG